MSRYCGDRDSTPILVAAEEWRTSCLLSDAGSVFTGEPIWTAENFDHLVKHYVENLDWGEGNFYEKLAHQLVKAPSPAKLLCAELMWLMLLCPSNIKPPKKRENIHQITSWSGTQIPEDHPMLSDATLTGVGSSAGTAYSSLRWKEISYAVKLFKALYTVPVAERSTLLSDKATFTTWLEDIDDNEQRQFRHMLLFMLFPDGSERIFSSSDRRKVLAAFRGKKPRNYASLSAQQLDKEIAKIRVEQKSEYPDTDLDWYVPPLRVFWLDTSKTGEYDGGKSFYPILENFIAQSRTQDLKAKDYPSGFEGLTLRVSFGTGSQAHVTWIAFLGPNQTPMKGIYPIYLYYKADNRLILSRGISSSNKPAYEWDVQEPITIDEFFQNEFGHKPIRYGDSLIFADYDLTDALDEEQLDSDLQELLTEYRDLLNVTEVKASEGDYTAKPETKPTTSSAKPYILQQALKDLFIPQAQAEQILSLLETKKNVILQGPPGTGKSFASKRLAYALIGAKDDNRVEMIQFHQSYSYEDFIQGYRPSDSGFELKDGHFHQFCKKAVDDPDRKYVFIIDEINRGNLSKIFGELMLLIEADKRGPDWQIPLTYSQDINTKFYIPENLYVIGLMNTADRLLAMVDFALRRRFAFFSLVPQIGSEVFQRDLTERGADDAMIVKLVSRLGALNERIAADALNLGTGFCIGHSFFCGVSPTGLYDDLWFEQIVRFEIEPLIREYWFDDPQTADSIVAELLAAQ